jgi:hypothetical protein
MRITIIRGQAIPPHQMCAFGELQTDVSDAWSEGGVKEKKRVCARLVVDGRFLIEISAACGSLAGKNWTKKKQRKGKVKAAVGCIEGLRIEIMRTPPTQVSRRFNDGHRGLLVGFGAPQVTIGNAMEHPLRTETMHPMKQSAKHVRDYAEVRQMAFFPRPARPMPCWKMSANRR